MATRNLSVIVRSFRRETSNRLWTSGWLKACSGVTLYGRWLRAERGGYQPPPPGVLLLKPQRTAGPRMHTAQGSPACPRRPGRRCGGTRAACTVSGSWAMATAGQGLSAPLLLPMCHLEEPAALPTRLVARALSAPAVCEASPLLPPAHLQIRTPARTPSVGAPPAPAHRARHAPADTAATREHISPCGSPGRAREVTVPLVGPTSRPEGAERLPPFVPQGWRPSRVRQRAAHTPPAERPRLPRGPERALTCADPSGPPSG